MKKRILSFTAAMLLFVSLFTGCGKPEPEPEPTSEPVVTEDPHAGMVEVSDGNGGTMWVKAAEKLTVFPLDRSAFSVSEGVVDYAGEGYTVELGVDVSEHQGEIDWQAVAASGVSFAVLRCGWRGYGGGSLNEDTYFRRNIEGAHAAGLDVGVYFFSQAVSVAEAAEEALYTIGLLEGYALELPVFFDWENIGIEPARTDDVDGETLTAAAVEYCHILASEGYETGVYTYLTLAYNKYDLDRLEGQVIWSGDPGSQPDFYYDHEYWQYSFTGTVSGIEGEVDRNARFVPISQGGKES